jgi:C-terminal processing protease CtpA/Prc
MEQCTGLGSGYDLSAVLWCAVPPGDEVISINDQDTEGWTGEMAAKLLRGKGGTEVRHTHINQHFVS